MTRLSHKRYRLIFILILAVAPFAAQALTPSQVFDKVKDTVVVIKSLNAKGEPLGQGSGVMLPTGKVATNCHVVKDGARFQAGRDNSFVPATLFAADADKDICLLQADKLTGTPAQLGKAGTLKVGEAVYAVGAPQGLELSLSNGLVSQLRGGTPPLIQTTAAISQGSSGGGLFDSEARLVGFTTYYYKDGQSLNFAMPVEWLSEIKPGKLTTKSTVRSQLDWATESLALMKSENWAKLRDFALLGIQANPLNDWAWSDLGFAYAQLNLLTDAVDAYRQALRINSDAADYWFSLGYSYSRLNRHNEAIDSYRNAIRINPKHISSFYFLGNSYKDINLHIESIDSYRKALRINPDHSGAWSGLGHVYLERQRYEDAIDAYRQALRLDPQDASKWALLGGSYSKMNNYIEAIEALNRSLRIEPKNAIVLNLLVLTYYLNSNTKCAAVEGSIKDFIGGIKP